MTKEEYILNYNDINYCEILILPNGEILLARPSHTEALINLSNIPRSRLNALIPNSASPIHWLIEKLNVAAVWYESVILSKGYTEEQIETILFLLESKRLHHGLSLSLSTEYSHFLKDYTDTSYSAYLASLNAEVIRKLQNLRNRIYI